MNILGIREDLKKAGPRVRKILKERNIPVAKAAEELDYDRSYYYKFLSGKRAMGYEMVLIHCIYLGVSLETLLPSFPMHGGDEEAEHEWEDLEQLLFDMEEITERLKKLSTRSRQKAAVLYAKKVILLLER